ncbi:MAG: hypothetical protein KG028_02270 [Actinobacteria bacterium]|jgi:predicted small lipoprotein YifL|nr:hypothetical protein [Actinomycetota bacterium]
MRTTHAAVLAALLLAIAGCGSDVPTDPDTPTSDVGADPTSGMCAPGVTDCVDVDLGADADAFETETERETATAMLGLAEDELAPDVRVGRRGDEQMALTEDYVLGRKTVELDEDDQGTYRVVSVVVELPDGPETITP